MLQNFVPTKRMLGLGEDARVKIVLEVNEERLATCTFLRSVADEFAARVGETGALEHAICAVEWLLTCMTGPQTVRWDYIRSIVSQDTFVAVCFCNVWRCMCADFAFSCGALNVSWRFVFGLSVGVGLLAVMVSSVDKKLNTLNLCANELNEATIFCLQTCRINENCNICTFAVHSSGVYCCGQNCSNRRLVSGWPSFTECVQDYAEVTCGGLYTLCCARSNSNTVVYKRRNSG